VIPTVRLVRRQERVDDDFGEDETPGFSTVDFRAGVRFLERYEIGLSISNLLDKNYNEHLTREDPFMGAEVPEPGRVVSMSLRAEF
jgi:iron complex outermembrane receptor protein